MCKTEQIHTKIGRIQLKLQEKFLEIIFYTDFTTLTSDKNFRQHFLTHYRDLNASVQKSKSFF